MTPNRIQNQKTMLHFFVPNKAHVVSCREDPNKNCMESVTEWDPQWKYRSIIPFNISSMTTN